MKYNILIVVVLLFTATACSACPKIEGEYATSGGSEKFTNLNLLQDHTFILKHEIWQPGAYENKETNILSGNWSCKKNKLTLSIEKLIYKAEYVTVGNNPLGINEKTMVIHFSPFDGNNDEVLNNEIFYPITALHD